MTAAWFNTWFDAIDAVYGLRSCFSCYGGYGGEFDCFGTEYANISRPDPRPPLRVEYGWVFLPLAASFDLYKRLVKRPGQR